MTWNAVLENWCDLAECLCRDFPYLDSRAVGRFRGDHDKLIEYLADTHHLTRSEATDALGDWIAFKAPRAQDKLAA